MFQVASTIEQVKSMADKTWQLKVGTQELTPEQFAQVASLKDKIGWFLFSENPITTDEIPKELAPEFKGEKTPSQRLRNTLYVYWNECTNKIKPFNTFYDEWIERKLKEIKDYLPEQKL